MRWLRRLRPDRDSRPTPLAEPMEPRLLYSADLSAGLLLATGTAEAAPEVRTLTSSGEYAAATTTASGTAAAASTYASASLAFEANAGQAPDGVDFSAYGSGYGIALDGGEASLTLVTAEGQRTVTLQLQGADATPQGEGEGLLATRSNVIVGADPSQWATGLANYASVIYRGVYDGVDLRYYGTQRQLEYDFIVAAGADASQIALRFDGTSGASVADDGDLVLRVGGSSGEVRFRAPVSWQRAADGSLEAVASRYEVRADGSIGFVLGDYDHARELVIDPVLDYATYFGGTSTDSATAVAVDSAGNVYITGHTNSTSGPFGSGGGGGGDIYVAKFSADLSSLLWCTRIGGSADEQGNAIAVDANGNVAVAGWTKSNDFPDVAAILLGPAGGQQAVVFKLDGSGNLVFADGFDGNAGTDSANAVGFDSAGSVYAAGQISASGLLSGVLGTVLGSSVNAFVEKFTATGSLVYEQQFGGGATDGATGMAVGSGGDVYVVGNTQSSDFQTENMATLNGHQAVRAAGIDGFLVRFDASGNAVYGTYVGGSNDDMATAVAIDGSGKAAMVGVTKARTASSFPTTTGALLTTPLAGSNNDTGFMRVYDTGQAGAASLAYSTFIGGSGVDTPTGVAYTGGRVVVAGYGNSTDLALTSDAVQTANPGSALFVQVIDPAGAGAADLVYGTWYGSGITSGGVTTYGRTIYVVGTTTAASGIATTGAYQTARSGTSDGMVLALQALPNSAPVLSGAVQPGAILEDSNGGSGFLVSSLVAGQVTDADVGAQPGVAIVGADNSHGSWQYSLDGGSAWNAVGSATGANALLLAADAQTRLRFVPAADYNGTVASGLTVRAWDRTDGVPGGRANIAATGGSTAFSTASFGVNITVTPVNDPPVANADSFATVEDTPININLADLLANDSDVEGSALQVVSVTSGPGGTAVLNGNGTVKFTPDANFDGTATFTYVVSDGTANSAPGTVTITVTPVNDEPVANDDSGVTDEDTPITFTAAQLLGNDTDAEGSPLAIVSVSGTGAVLNADGSVTFTPPPDFNGSTNFKYEVSDGTLVSKQGKVTITVNPVNDAPVAVADTLDAVSGTPITYTAAQLLGNDSDVDGDVLTLGSVTSGTGGTAVLNADGTVTFTPTAGFAGNATFSYTAKDGSLSSNAATVTVRVNDVPVANADTLAATEDATITYAAADLLGNDTDSVGNPLVIAGVGNATGGTVALNADGTVTFTPLANFNGTASFTYTASDGTLVSAPATVTIDVAAVNDAPVANADSGTTGEDTTITFTAAQLLGNDADVEGSSLTIISVSGAVLNADGSVTFTPPPDFNGTASFQYEVSDGSQVSNKGTVTVTVNPVNDVPVLRTGAVDDLAVVEGSGLTSLGLGGLAYDAGPANESAQNLTFTVTAVPSGVGTIVLADGTTVVSSGTYTLAQIQGMQFRTGGWSSGTGTFTFTVSDNGGTANGGSDTLQQSLTITVKNQAPTLSGLNAMDVDEDPAGNDGMLVADLVTGHIADPLNAWGVAVTAASDPNGSWEFSLDGGSTWGAITGVSDSHALLLGPDGNTRLRFVPAADYSGPAGGLTLRAWDQSSGTIGDFADTRVNGGETAFSADAQTVAVTVHPVNDAPVVDLNGPAGGQDVVVDFTEQVPVAVAPSAVLADVDSGNLESLTLTLVARPDGDGVESLTLDATALGLASDAGLSVSYTASTGVLAITGSASRATYEAILRGVLYTNGSDAPDTGDRTVTVVATDGAASAGTRTSTIRVAPVNDAPAAGAVTLPPLAEDAGPITITTAQLLAGATDPDGDALAVSGVTASSGTLQDNLDGTWTFTPDPDDDTGVTFTYTVSDGALTAAGTASLDLTPVNDAPVGVPDTLATTEDVAVTFSASDLLGNDVDADGDTLAIAGVTSGTGGTAVLNADGTVTFTPGANFTGAASFTYTVTDGTATSAPATVTVNVAAVNDAPVANDDTLTATEDQAITWTAADLLGNDGDVEGSVLTIASVTSGPGGTAILNADGTVTFTPGANFNGTATFTYTVSDGTATSAPATVTVNVAAVNDAPVANAETLAATVDQAITFSAADLLGNDADVDGDTLTIAAVTSGAGGTAVLNADGTVTFTPGANFNGSATFTYTVSDGTTVSAPATVTVNVAAVNDAPVANDDTLAATEDQAILFGAADLLGNDTDADTGDRLKIAGVTSGTGGTAVLNADGTVTFTPGANFNGAATFTYTMTDGTTTSSATVTVNVAAVNDAPVANADALAATEDQAITWTDADLLGNDGDVEGSPLAIASVTSGPGGTAVLNADGTVTFTPGTNFNGTATFTYTVTDGTATSAPATVTVAVGPVNDVPVTSPVGLPGMAEDGGTVTIGEGQLLANASDADGDPLTVTGLVASSGTLVDNGDGTWSFTPAANANGTVTFTYGISDGMATTAATATLVVAAVNDAPATSDVTLPAMQEDGGTITLTTADLLANASDVEGDTLAVTGLVASTGSLVDNGNGTWSFTPGANYNGTMTFSYTVGDGAASTAASARLVVAAVNDAPTTAVVTLPSMQEDGGTVTLTEAQLLANAQDVDGDALSVANLSASSGTLVANGDGTWSFTPAANASGTVTFSFDVSDGIAVAGGSATITVAPVNDAPAATPVSLPAMAEDGGPVTITSAQLLASASDVEGSALSVVNLVANSGTLVDNGNGTWRFTPAADFNGTVTFRYGVSDGTATIAASASLPVTPVDDAPRITSDGGRPTATVLVAENTSGATTVAATDVDTPAASLSYRIGGGADAALFTIDARTGALAFVRAPDFEAAGDGNRDNVYEVVVQVSDGNSVTQQALAVRVTDLAEPVPQPPAPPPAPVPPPPAPAPAPAVPPPPAAPAPAPAAAAPATDTRGTRTGETLQEALGPTMPAPVAAFNNDVPSFATTPARIALAADGSHVFRTVVFDRGGLELISTDPDAQLVLARFGIASGGDGARLDDFQRTLRSAAFSSQLDRLRESVREDLDLDKSVQISVVSVSLGLSLVYVLWLIRGGVLLGSYLSALPAWRLLDPLPVLSRVEDEEDDEEPLEGGQRGGRDVLRGF